MLASLEMYQCLSFVVFRQENQESQEIKGQRVGVANMDQRVQKGGLAQEACKETGGYLDCLGHRDDQYDGFNHLITEALIM